MQKLLVLERRRRHRGPAKASIERVTWECELAAARARWITAVIERYAVAGSNPSTARSEAPPIVSRW